MLAWIFRALRPVRKPSIIRRRPQLEALEDRCVPSGSSLSYATYLGGDNSDDVTSVALDSAGNIYLAGRTDSSYFVDPSHPKPLVDDAFVAKLDRTGTQLLYVHYFDTRAIGGRYAVAVDSNGSAYIAGPTVDVSNIATSGAAQTTHGGNGDVFVAKLSPDGNTVVYCTYIGGNQLEDIGIGTQEGAQSLAVDANGN